LEVPKPHPKLQSRLSRERVKLQKKPIKNFGEKGAWAYSGTAQIFGVPLLSQERVKLQT